MKVVSEQLPGRLARLEIELEQEQVDKEIDRAYKRLANRVMIPGFRRGKAPRVLVERALGDGALLEEAAKELVPHAVTTAIEQEDLQPIAQASDFNLLTSEPYTFEVTVPLVPVVTLGDYRAVRVERQPVAVTDEQVDEVIQGMREREGEWTIPDPPRPAREGDGLILDVEDYVDGERIARQTEVQLVLGQGTLLEELESQLVGVEADKHYEFSATMPEEHPNPDVAGKEAQFKVSITSIEEQTLPELDDEFASRVNPSVTTVEELQATLRESLQARAEQAERERVLGETINQIVAGAQVDLPEILIEHELDEQLERLESGLQASNLRLDQFLRATEQTQEEMRENSRESARERVVRGLVLSEVARAEGINVEDEEIDEAADAVANRIDAVEVENARRILAADAWRGATRSQIYERKLLDRLMQLSTGEPAQEVDVDQSEPDFEPQAAEPPRQKEPGQAARDITNQRYEATLAASSGSQPDEADEEQPPDAPPEDAPKQSQPATEPGDDEQPTQ